MPLDDDPATDQVAAHGHGIRELSARAERRLRERALFTDVRLLGAVSCGGVLGALGRYGLQVAFPHGAGEFGWATLAINVSGSLLIGIIAVAIAASPGAHRLLRPFLVTGVLGGYTTFSTYIADISKALAAAAPRTALAYAAVTLVTALAAAWAGMWLGSAVIARRTGAEAEVADAGSGSGEGAGAGEAS